MAVCSECVWRWGLTELVGGRREDDVREASFDG